MATANLGPERASITILDEDRRGEWTLHNLFAATPSSTDHEFRSLSGGIAFLNNKQVWVSDGESGQVLLIDTAGGSRKKVFDLNARGTVNSYPSAISYDDARNILCVVDQAHSRVVVFDTKRNVEAGSVSTGFLPYAISLSSDGQRAWVSGSKSVSRIDLSKPEIPNVMGSVDLPGDGGPSSVLATERAIYVSETRDDTIYAIDPGSGVIKGAAPIRIPGLESLRGVWPSSMAIDEASQRLFVTEAGLNAVGVIDTKKNGVLGHIPVGWAPLGIAVRDGIVYVANAKGRGTGPSSVLVQPDAIDFPGLAGRGSISKFPLPGTPGAGDLAKQTGLVFAANGLLPARDLQDRALPIHYVVLILKGNRTFDDTLGDVRAAASPVSGVARLAIFGKSGHADGGKGRFSLHNIDVTPNQHSLAEQFAFSDNFYADGETAFEGYRWLTGDFPFVFSHPTKPDSGTLWKHLEIHGISCRNFGDFAGGGDPRVQVSDQHRADQFIQEIDSKYAKNGQPLPQFLFLSLPNDSAGAPDPAHGYPYTASYVADNDAALGKIVQYLSHSPWWREMAIFVTEAGADRGRDHVDAHRTILLGVGPYLKRDYVSHTNASYPALLKTVLRLLHVPPLNLFDATAADLTDWFASEASFQPYTFIPTDSHLFDSELAHEN